MEIGIALGILVALAALAVLAVGVFVAGVWIKGVRHD